MQLVGLCDRNHAQLQQVAQKYGIKRNYRDLGQMLKGVLPDVVHILTLPHTQEALTIQTLEAATCLWKRPSV